MGDRGADAGGFASWANRRSSDLDGMAAWTSDQQGIATVLVAVSERVRNLAILKRVFAPKKSL